MNTGDGGAPAGDAVSAPSGCPYATHGGSGHSFAWDPAAVTLDGVAGLATGIRARSTALSGLLRAGSSRPGGMVLRNAGRMAGDWAYAGDAATAGGVALTLASDLAAGKGLAHAGLHAAGAAAGGVIGGGIGAGACEIGSDGLLTPLCPYAGAGGAIIGGIAGGAIGEGVGDLWDAASGWL